MAGFAVAAAVIALWVALAGSLGAVTRFVVDSALRARFAARLPWPTVLINITGSWLLGLLVGAVHFHGATGLWVTIAGGGFCGGYTTFSTTGVDTVRLMTQRRCGAAAVIALGTLVATVAAAAAGFATAALW